MKIIYKHLSIAKQLCVRKSTPTFNPESLFSATLMLFSRQGLPNASHSWRTIGLGNGALLKTPMGFKNDQNIVIFRRGRGGFFLRGGGGGGGRGTLHTTY